MRFRLQLITVGEDGSERMHSVAELERDSTLRLETAGLTLAEGKQILKHLQEVVVEEQVQACMVQTPTLRDLQQAAAQQRPSSDQTTDGFRQPADQKPTSPSLPLWRGRSSEVL